jgi:hypothetical protein
MTWEIDIFTQSVSPGNDDNHKYHKEQSYYGCLSNWIPGKLQHPIVTRSQKIVPGKSHHKSGQVEEGSKASLWRDVGVPFWDLHLKKPWEIGLKTMCTIL